MVKEVDPELKKKLLIAQESEITEHIIYKKLSEAVKDENNRKVLAHISKDELKHHNYWKSLTKADVSPGRFRVWKYYWISRIFGITFGLKLMEIGEGKAQVSYGELSKQIPNVKSIIRDEHKHEKAVLKMLDEERLQYVGSMMLGLNDALVELTGALAGFTLAFQNAKLVAMTGLITGIAASLSMGASEYLSKKTEGGNKSPVKASIYTGAAYIIAVMILILPFLLLNNVFISLGWSLLNAIIIILVFTFYISVAKEYSFRRRFLEMALISLSIAALSFGIGFLMRVLFNIEV